MVWNSYHRKKTCFGRDTIRAKAIDPAAIKSYWTKKRMDEAKPVPVPTTPPAVTLLEHRKLLNPLNN
ncbi:hypothetical protein [Nitrosomonas sp. Nm166]|uniref:hypothetical protein n=1 Tax=Nitrosomonas sp. Nm166 TaxID=1881054 RepID=UPI000B850297|nr:hypothetical protein [Nitrosomonas sp. Nm166]